MSSIVCWGDADKYPLLVLLPNFIKMLVQNFIRKTPDAHSVPLQPQRSTFEGSFEYAKKFSSFNLNPMIIFSIRRYDVCNSQAVIGNITVWFRKLPHITAQLFHCVTVQGMDACCFRDCIQDRDDHVVRRD